MTTVRSALDLGLDLPDSRALVAFSSACGQRAVSLWTAEDDPQLAARLRDVLAETWRSAETGERCAIDLAHAILDGLHEDADFGHFHQQRLHSLVVVAHAAAAAAALEGEDADVLREVKSAAAAEINILKSIFYNRTGGYAGVLEDVAVGRHLEWQRQDLVDLAAGSASANINRIRSRAALAGTLLRAGVMKGDWSGSLPHLDDPTLF